MKNIIQSYGIRSSTVLSSLTEIHHNETPNNAVISLGCSHMVPVEAQVTGYCIASTKHLMQQMLQFVVVAVTEWL